MCIRARASFLFGEDWKEPFWTTLRSRVRSDEEKKGNKGCSTVKIIRPVSPTAAMVPEKVADPAPNRTSVSSPVAKNLVVDSEWELSDSNDEITMNHAGEDSSQIEHQELHGKGKSASSSIRTRSQTKKSKQAEGEGRRCCDANCHRMQPIAGGITCLECNGDKHKSCGLQEKSEKGDIVIGKVCIDCWLQKRTFDLFEKDSYGNMGEVQEAAAGKSKDATNEEVDCNDIEAEKEEKSAHRGNATRASASPRG